MSPSGPVPAIIVVEEGGELPEGFGRTEGRMAPLVIRQGAGESLSDFSARVGHDLQRLAPPGAMELALLSCSDRSDAATFVARRNTAAAILSSVARRGVGTLTLLAGRRGGPPAVARLEVLAADLDAEWEDLGLRVSVRSASQVSRVA